MKKYDITDKLAFNENPVIKIKDLEIEIDADAKTVLQVGIAMEKDDSFETLLMAYNTLFSESDRKKIEKLKLKGAPFMQFVNAAVILAMGGDPEVKGEA